MAELAHQELLFTIAEIAAAFVGFSMVVGLLGDEPSEEQRFYSIRDVAEVGLSSLAGALLPSAVHAFGPEPAFTWRLASTLFAIGWVGAAFIGIRRFVGIRAQGRPSLFYFTGPLMSGVGFFLLCWNVLAPDALSPARYVAGLLLLLAFAGVSFISATFQRRAPETED